MPELPKVLLIDDDPSFLRATSLGLQDHFHVQCIHDPRNAEPHLGDADAIVSDFRMQFLSGNDILTLAQARLRPIPVILVSAYASKRMAIDAANLRVFAILEKPICLEQLNSYLTRATTGRKRSSQIFVNSDNLTATIGSIEIRLTLTEFKILEIFLQSPNTPIHRDALIHAVWGNCILTENVLDTHLGNLKRKIPVFSQRFKLIRGRGYVYAE